MSGETNSKIGLGLPDRQSPSRYDRVWLLLERPIFLASTPKLSSEFQKRALTTNLLASCESAVAAFDDSGEDAQKISIDLAPAAPWFQLACKRHLFHAIHAAAFRLSILVRASVDDCKVLWFRSSARRKLISPPSKMAKPER